MENLLTIQIHDKREVFADYVKFIVHVRLEKKNKANLIKLAFKEIDNIIAMLKASYQMRFQFLYRILK